MSYTPLPPLGQAAKAASLPVVIASDQDVLSTSAKQDIIISHVDGIETLLTAIDGHIDQIEGYVDGIETLITSTNTKLDTVNTNLGTIDGRVDGLETLITATNTKLDTLLTQTDGLETSNSAIQTSVELIDDAIKADDAPFTPATTKVMMAGFEYDDTAPDSVDEGDAGAARMSANRNQYMQIRDAAGNERGVNVDANNRLLAALDAVHFQDVFVTGQGSQLALSQNVILASAGTGSYDTLNGTTGNSFRSFSIEIVPAAGTVTAGVITFEGSNDNTNFTPIFLVDEANITAVPVSTVTLAATTNRYFKGPIAWRYVRARISTGITGTTTGVQAFTRFSTVPFTDQRLTVSQATAASLNVTATMTSTTLTAVTPGTAAANLGKARDSAIGATDTGVMMLGVRRDAPAAETPVAGDMVVPQISANGEQWVGMAASAVNSPAKAEDAVHASGDVGMFALAVRTDTPASTSSATGDYDALHTGARGDLQTSVLASTVGGYTPYKLVSAATTNATNVKASAGTVGYITVSNVNAAARYLKLYNKASAPTVGTDTPVHTFIIPGNTAGAGTNIPLPPQGIAFSTGISFALTTEATDAGSTAVAVSEIVVNLGYI